MCSLYYSRSKKIVQGRRCLAQSGSDKCRGRETPRRCYRGRRPAKSESEEDKQFRGSWRVVQVGRPPYRWRIIGASIYVVFRGLDFRQLDYELEPYKLRLSHLSSHRIITSPGHVRPGGTQITRVPCTGEK